MADSLSVERKEKTMVLYNRRKSVECPRGCFFMNRLEAISQLLRIHGYFMLNPRFWYEKNLMEADKLICVAMSDLRRTDA
jgi:hypothetical protein